MLNMGHLFFVMFYVFGLSRRPVPVTFLLGELAYQFKMTTIPSNRYRYLCIQKRCVLLSIKDKW